MEVNKQIDYDIRTYISDLNDKAIEKGFNSIRRKLSQFSDFELICYSLISIENEFQKDSFINGSFHQNAGNKRIVLEWFQKKLLDKKIKRTKFEFDEEKYNIFEECLSDILPLVGNYLVNEKFKQNRGIDKILIEVNENNEYYFKYPSIKDNIDCQETYFFEQNNNKDLIQQENKIKSEAIIKIINKYFMGKSELSIKEFLSIDKVDNEIYELCKNQIKIDVDKIGCEFSSNIFSNKNQLIDILSVFLYLSYTFKLETEMESIRPLVLFKKPIIIKKDNLINKIEKFMPIDCSRIIDIIDYFTINSNMNWGINEYPLINIDKFILWMPSSFMMNDFQFSIVNGHYGKKINIINRDKTVSESIVQNIISKCETCKNVVIAREKEYFDKNHLFNGKELKSDIDVAIYDTISNSLLIIECKWKERLFLKGAKYDKICDEVEKIHKNQLDKHKYFLQLDLSNLDFIFNNDERVRNRPYYPRVQYIMIDKRIQLHYDGRHTLSEFNFLKIIKDNIVNNKLILDNVISYINTLNTKVDYSTGNVISRIEYDNKIIKNSLFTL